MPFFSIIICLYNIEQYFIKGISYILNQNFKDFEIILVDDGSSDKTPLLIDEIVSKYNNVKILRQPNKGPGIARNEAIKIAQGKYLCFFDIDDKVPAEWLKILHYYLSASNIEVLIFGYTEINLAYNYSICFKFNNKEFYSNSEVGKNFVDSLSGLKFNNGYVWNKVYLREFIVSNNIKFPDIRLQEDELFNHEVYKKVTHLKIIEEILYDYILYTRFGNSNNRLYPTRYESFIKAKKSFINLCLYWDIRDQVFDLYIHRRFLNNMFYNRNRNIPRQIRLLEIKNMVESKEVKKSIEKILEYKINGSCRFENNFIRLCVATRNKSVFLVSILLSYRDTIIKFRYLTRKLIQFCTSNFVHNKKTYKN